MPKDLARTRARPSREAGMARLGPDRKDLGRTLPKPADVVEVLGRLTNQCPQMSDLGELLRFNGVVFQVMASATQCGGTGLR